MDKIIVPLPDGGQLVARASQDPMFPGIYIDYENTDEKYKEVVSMPAVVMEYHPKYKLRAAIWGDPELEDFTTDVHFSLGG